MIDEPGIGRIVWYRSKLGGYIVPAIVTCTADTLLPAGVQLYEETKGRWVTDTKLRAQIDAGEVIDMSAQGVPPLSSDLHVHLTVFSPGLPGNDEVPGPNANAGGSYRKWDIGPSIDGSIAPKDGEERPVVWEQGTWAWPPHIAPGPRKAHV